MLFEQCARKDGLCIVLRRRKNALADHVLDRIAFHFDDVLPRNGGHGMEAFRILALQRGFKGPAFDGGRAFFHVDERHLAGQAAHHLGKQPAGQDDCAFFLHGCGHVGFNLKRKIGAAQQQPAV